MTDLAEQVRAGASPVTNRRARRRDLRKQRRRAKQRTSTTDPDETGPPQQEEPDVEADAQSIATFCRRNGITVQFYYLLRKRGEGPDEKRIGRRVLISREAAARWRETTGTAKAPEHTTTA